MKRVWRIFRSVVDSSSTIGGIAAGVCIFFIGLIIGYEVFMRYVLVKPSIWVTEVSQFLLGFTIFIAAAVCLKEDVHIVVDIITSRLPKKAASILNVITSIIAFSFCLVFFWLSYQWWYEAYSEGWITWGLLSVSLYIPYIVVPLGIGLLCLQFVVKIINSLVKGFGEWNQQRLAS